MIRWNWSEPEVKTIKWEQLTLFPNSADPLIIVEHSKNQSSG